MKIGITGQNGRMGQMLIQELRGGAWPDLQLAGGIGRDGDAENLFKISDAVIDFTRPEATRNHVALAAQKKKILIVGTTGLTAEDESVLNNAAQQTVIVSAPNMSVGVNLLLALVEQAAARLGPDWDAEIYEAHHKNKIDAPSGTALALGKAVANQRGGAFVTDRHGARKQGDIGFSVARGGDVVGEHSVTFYGAGERISLQHMATNRALFARGALKAAEWAKGQKPGLYFMRDVLGV
ncbi:MAG: 4-hydroxy-tetrahydrodipicolinate reductase [Alphaproteobacteria bacterium]|nr:4-hydroxy-tetrahydrodipicolinate reductase [Alphaproteobacteria bacterium]